MQKLLISGAELLTAPSGEKYYIYIEEKKINFIAQTLPANFTEDGVATLNADGLLATAGMVNTHGHVSMTLLRSYADDMQLMDWLQNKIWPIEAKMTAKDIYWGAMLGIAEMLKGGTTCFADMYAEMDEVAKATAQLGIRANLCRGMIGSAPNGYQSLEENNAFFRDWHNYNDGQIRVSYGPHAPYTCPDSFLKDVLAAAEVNGAEIQMHLCETKTEISDSLKEFGETPIARMERLGLFEPGLIAAHCVHLSDADRAIMARRHVRVAHNPQSNLKLASGIADLQALLAAGITVGLGTDGASSNNNLDMLEETRLAATLHKAAKFDPLAITAEQAWQLATAEGAKVLGFADTGRLAAGAAADIVLWNMHKPYWYPRHNKLSQLVYAAAANDAHTVIVQGNTVVRDGRLLTFDEEKIYAEAAKAAAALLQK